jgi:hypothetical protein
MENKTYIKLFRKLKDHEVFSDEKALRIFIWILLTVDYKTGKMKSGRFWAAERLDMKPRTYHKVLTERLEKRYKLVTLFSDNKKTVISVNKWHEYQGDSDTTSDNKVTTKGQQSDTTQEVKNKRSINNINRRNANVDGLLKRFEEIVGHPPTDKKPRYEAYNLSRRINKLIKELKVIGKEVEFEKVADGYFGWFSNQSYVSGVENMSTARLKFIIYSDGVKKQYGI